MDAWVSDLEALAEAAAQEGFSELVESPKLSVDQKREAVAQVLPALSPEGLNLATLLVAKGRLAALALPLAAEFHRLLDEHRGIVRAEVVTAVEPDQAERGRIEQWLADVTGKGALGIPHRPGTRGRDGRQDRRPRRRRQRPVEAEQPAPHPARGRGLAGPEQGTTTKSRTRER